MSSKPQPSTRLLFLDSIRALAAIFVVLHHSIVNYYDPVIDHMSNFSDYHLHGIKYIIVKVLYQGHYAVDLFIVLSGFSLMLPALSNNYELRGGVASFFKRRILRIIPPYYFGIALSLALIWTVIGNKTHTHWDRCIPVDFKDIITHILLIHDFFTSTSSSINHVFWSVVVECRIYVFFPFLLFFWRKKGPLGAIFFATIISLIGFFLLSTLKSFVSSDIDTGSAGVSPYIILFTLGMLAADLSFSTGKNQDIFRSFYKKSPLLFVTINLVLLTILFLLSRLLFKAGSFSFIDFTILANHLTDIAIGYLCSVFLFIVTISDIQLYKKSGVLKLLYWKPLIFLGTISYSLYLVHPLALQFVSKFIIIPLKNNRFTSACQLAILGLIVSILFSYLFFLCFELPFLKIGKKNKAKSVEMETVTNPAP